MNEIPNYESDEWKAMLDEQRAILKESEELHNKAMEEFDEFLDRSIEFSKKMQAYQIAVLKAIAPDFYSDL